MLMRKRLLFAAFMGMVMTPCLASTEPVSSPLLTEASFASTVNIYFSGTTLRITGGANLTLSVYSLTGTKVMCQKIDGDDKSWNLNLQRGCYIVKVGNVVRKIAIA